MGNNAELSSDLYGRAVEIRLDSNLENPSERTGFAIKDVRRWTRQHRGELCAAALVLIRNWLDQGRPEPAEGTPYLGGFESWRRVMGGILSAAGVPGFLMNRQATKQRVNADDDFYRVFVEQWATAHGTALLSSKDLHPVAKDAGLFDEALASANEAGELRRLGRWLTKNADRVLAGHKIKAAKIPATGKKGYKLQPLNGKSAFGEPMEPTSAKNGGNGGNGGKEIGGPVDVTPISTISTVFYAPVPGEFSESPKPRDAMRF